MDIEKIFTYQPVTPEKIKKYTDLREEGKKFAMLIEKNCIEGREKAIAFTKLQEVIMWANASIALNG